MNFPLVNTLGEEEGRETQTEGLITKASVYQTPGKLSSVQSLSYVQLCDPMDCSTPGFPVQAN